MAADKGTACDFLEPAPREPTLPSSTIVRDDEEEAVGPEFFRKISRATLSWFDR
jgi:hypothetical protein